MEQLAGDMQIDLINERMTVEEGNLLESLINHCTKMMEEIKTVYPE